VYIRKTTRFKDGKPHHYWALVESYRTERGPRQRVVAWLGEMDKAGRLGVENAAKGSHSFQHSLFDKTVPEWVEIDVKGVRVENIRELGSVGSYGRGFGAVPIISSIERAVYCGAFV